MDGPEAPPTGRTTTKPAPTKSQRHQNNGAEPGKALQWVPCTWTYPQDLRSQLRRRRDAAARSVPLDCGCRDPYVCRCRAEPPSQQMVDAGADAIRHLLRAGYIPIVEPETLRALRARGGDNRALAGEIYDLAGGD